MIQSNLSYPDSCYPGTSLNRAADLPYFMLTLQKLWAVQWVWPITAYVFILHSEIRTNLSYGHPLIQRRPDKRGLTVATLKMHCAIYYAKLGGMESIKGRDNMYRLHTKGEVAQ